MKQLTFLLVILLSPLASNAGTGAELLAGCKQAIKLMSDSTATVSVDAGYCVGHVAGMRLVADIYMHTDKQLGYTENRFACFPKKANNLQTIMVIIKFLEDNPQRLHERDGILAGIAIRQAFPCK